MHDILVSICCFTYNHKNFLSQTLDGFLQQKVNFSIEILLHDDASNDGTVDIINSYAIQYPNLIKPILQQENIYSKGLLKTINVLNKSNGKYICMCEGDDFWCDPYKLQKQVDFLEENPEFMGCSHNTKILRESIENESKEEFVVSNLQKDIFTIDDFTKGEVYFHNSSYMYKQINNVIYDLLNRFDGDWYISMVFASFGPIKYIDEVMSVYRIHDKGVWSELSAQEQVMKNLDAILKINKAFDYKYEENFMQLFARVFITSKIDKSIANLSKLFDSLSKEELVKIIFYIEQYTKKQEEHIAYEKELWQQREDHIQKIQSSFGWKVGSLIDKLRG